jgi:hypothetical protein
MKILSFHLKVRRLGDYTADTAKTYKETQDSILSAPELRTYMNPWRKVRVSINMTTCK